MKRLLTLVLLTPALALVPGTARAQAPDAVGWWSAAHRSSVPVVVPPAPDVTAGDLLLQGGDVQRELPNTAPAPTALGALRYALPDGATVDRLTLQVATGAQAMDVRAYATTSPWQPVENGAIEAAPVPDLSRYAVGTLTGSSLVFDDIGKLATEDGLLSVVLVPGVSDRVVVLPPKATALTVTQAQASEPDPPPTAFDPPTIPAGPALAPIPVAVAPAVPVVTVDVPQVVPSLASPQPQAPARPVVAAGVRRTVTADDSRTRLFVLLEAVLLTVFFGLLGLGPLAALARLTGSAEEVSTERGIGRFRTAREGTAARL
ncbi:MAG: hypothetical protein JWO22_46 [Frankiales bacterium]|nr:hypothetical protein [Frankiales bacterium]